MIASVHRSAALVEHTDDTVSALALAAADALPDVTALLVLADRFAELEDEPRERITRRMAALVEELHSSRFGVWPVIGFGPTMAREAIHRHLTEEEAAIVSWLSLWWLNGSFLGVGSVWQLPRYCALVPLRLHCPTEAFSVLDLLSPRDPGWFWPLPPAGRRNRRVWNSINRIRTGCYEFLGRAVSRRTCFEAATDAVMAYALQLQEPWFSRARQRAWQELGGLVELITGYPARRLGSRARRKRI